MTTGIRKRRTARFGIAMIGASFVGGCAMPDASNPTLTITSVRVFDERAMLDLTIANPSDFDLKMTSLDYTLTFGPLPVASGTWPGEQVLLSKQSVNVRLGVSFDMPPIDATADEVELSGLMHFDDSSNTGAMAMSEASFNVTGKVRP